MILHNARCQTSGRPASTPSTVLFQACRLTYRRGLAWTGLRGPQTSHSGLGRSWPRPWWLAGAMGQSSTAVASTEHTTGSGGPGGKRLRVLLKGHHDRSQAGWLRTGRQEALPRPRPGLGHERRNPALEADGTPGQARARATGGSSAPGARPRRWPRRRALERPQIPGSRV